MGRVASRRVAVVCSAVAMSFAMIVACGSKGSDAKIVMVDGKIVFRNGQFMNGPKPGEVLQEAEKLGQDLIKSAGLSDRLVSHWPVEEVAAATLARLAFQHKNAGRAEAFKLAMQEVRKGHEPHVSHPSYWAPFVVVGEGGR